MLISRFHRFRSPVDRRGWNSIDCDGPRWVCFGGNRTNKRNIFEIFPAVLDNQVGGGRQSFPTCVRKAEVMQIVPPALMKIVGEYWRRLATYSRAGSGFVANLKDCWPQTRVRDLIVREIVSGAAEPKRI